MPAFTVEDFLLASKRCEIVSLEQLVLTGQLVRCIRQLVHQLQKERGLSNIYLVSNGERFARQRLEQIQHCQLAQQHFKDYLETLNLTHYRQADGRQLFTHLAYVLHGLTELTQQRQQIEAHRIQAKDSTLRFNQLIAHLLSVIFEAADAASDPEITRYLVALLNVMQGKELSGQERAWGACGFAAGHFTQDEKHTLQHLVDAQQNCFATFLEFAPQRIQQQWTDLQTTDCTQELIRLRQIVERSTDAEAIPSAFSEIWYDVVTCRIDAMKAIEEQLATDLLTLCQTKLASAKDDLQHHHQHIEAWQQQHVTIDLEQPQPMGRCVYQLLTQQSQRLNSLNNELIQARQALTERKAIERAKGIIMTTQQVNEEHAYRQLQQAAMSQKKRMYDIAITIIDLVKRHPTTQDTQP